jgi:hypothetical protein
MHRFLALFSRFWSVLLSSRLVPIVNPEFHPLELTEDEAIEWAMAQSKLNEL